MSTHSCRGLHCLAHCRHLDPLPPEEEKWEYIRVPHSHYKFHCSPNLLTNHELQLALAQHATTVDTLFNCGYNNHFWKGSVAHLVLCSSADIVIPLPIHPTPATTIFLEAGLKAYKRPAGPRQAVASTATTLDTPASTIFLLSYAGQHLDRYSVIAAIGLANRIRTCCGRATDSTLSQTDFDEAVDAERGPPAKADRVRLMALANLGRSAAQIANTLSGSGRWHEIPGSIFVVDRWSLQE
ncbi:hypothetical protein Rhopal_005945-T1 [Rhodotorula paludigena]|uniref:Uncharacterized protein n=1 Tax=Rhodotorula paludigena TaxID=86838 RepID=A0AAV5GSL6_9BASI|nr:hypothetical protein Rhopal_005945-T1 [Rhodotorula paludigena]